MKTTEKKNKKERQSLRHIASNMFFVLRYSFKSAPMMTLILLFYSAIDSAIRFFKNTWLLGFIIDSVEAKRPFHEVALAIVAVVGVFLLWSVVIDKIMTNYIYPKGKKRLEKAMNSDIYKKAAEIDLACYDNPEFYDDFVWASSTAVQRADGILRTISYYVESITAILISGLYFAGNDLIGIAVAVVSFVTSFAVNRIVSKIRFKRSEDLKPLERKIAYLNRLFYLNDHAKEIRLNNVVGMIFGDYHRTAEMIGRERRKNSGKEAWYEIVGFSLVPNVLRFGYLTYLLIRAIVLKTLMYGRVVALFNAVNYLEGHLDHLSEILPQFEEHSMYIDKVRHFLDYEIKIKDPDEPKKISKNGGDIEIKNLSFAYGDKSVLKDINLTIHKGEKIALVGYNGAGKTTLVKLIMRLYDPTDGEIRYAGENIRDYCLKEYRKSFETVFQDFQIFAGTVGENISLSSAELDIERAQYAAKLAGFDTKLAEFEKGFDTEMTREFSDDGVILSGGEEQKLAITRALYRNSDVIILDEPSSALDPIAEYNLNHTMLTTQKDKTIITISHRLSTTRMADRIYMLEDGRIIESGTHDELMEKNGKYAEMFTLQAEKYKTEGVLE